MSHPHTVNKCLLKSNQPKREYYNDIKNWWILIGDNLDSGRVLYERKWYL